MTEVLIILAVTLAIMIAASLFFKNDEARVAPAFVIAAVAATLIAGMGIRVREMVEGPFTYLDTIMAVLTAVLYVTILYDNGTFQYIFSKILGKKHSALVNSYLMLLLVALPGMLTGTATASVITTGALVGVCLVKKGVSKAKAVEFIAVGSVLGMLLPPLNLPTMLVSTSRGGSFPGTFVGYALLLLVLGVPAFLIYGFLASKRIFGAVSNTALTEQPAVGKPLCLIPLATVIVLLIANDFLAGIVPFLGYPLIYTIGFVLAALLPAQKTNAFTSACKGVSSIAPVLAAAAAAGMMLEIFTLTGVSGTLTLSLINMNGPLLVLVMVLVTMLCGLFFGTPLAMTVSVLFSYIVGTVFYTTVAQEAVPLAALSVGLVLATLLPLRGGVIQKATDAIGCEAVDIKQVLTGAVVPVAVVLVLGTVFGFASKALAFLII